MANNETNSRPNYPAKEGFFKRFLKRLDEWFGKWFDRIVFLLAALAIVLAIIQFFDSRYQKRQMREIAKSVPTRYIGQFPKNMQDIIEVVLGSDKRLDVMTDFPGYGSYSSPKAFATYFNALGTLSTDKKVAIRMLVYEKKKATDVRAGQWRDIFDGEQNSPRFQHFFADYHPTTPKPKNYAEFEAALSEIEQDYETQLIKKGVQIKHVSSDLQFYLWLQDDDEDGVLSFQNSPTGAEETSFRTRDATLLKTFRDSFNRIWAHPEAPSGPVPQH